MRGAEKLFRSRGRCALAALACAAACACDVAPPPSVNRRPTCAIVDWPAEALVGQQVVVKVEGYDPDGDRVRVFVAWGDGDTADYGEFALSGQTLLFDHVYRRADSFAVRARCHDMAPLFSDWSAARFVRVTP